MKPEETMEIPAPRYREQLEYWDEEGHRYVLTDRLILTSVYRWCWIHQNIGRCGFIRLGNIIKCRSHASSSRNAHINQTACACVYLMRSSR